MAFQYINLYPSFAASGGLAKAWAYTTTDTLATVLASGYFNAEVATLGIGDVINLAIVNSLVPASRTTLTEAIPIVVVTNDGTTVTTKMRDFDSRNVVTFLDDFEGTGLLGTWGVTKGSDGACANFAVSADINGKVLATTGAGAGGSMAANGVQLHSALNWKANQTCLIFEARVKISAITNISVFIGLTDQLSALEAPITSAASANTITTNATDAVGFMFDTSMTDASIWLVGVANDVDATAQTTSLAFVADTYKTLRIEVTSAGVATFYMDGVLKGTAMTGALTATIALTPVVAGFTRTAASATISVDYIAVQAYRV